jgi:hypothetical protein
MGGNGFREIPQFRRLILGRACRASGEADADLNRYLSALHHYRADASALYARTMRRLDDEEVLEAQHADVRAHREEPKLPNGPSSWHPHHSDGNDCQSA